ncbi:hypothetical protein SP5_035_01450 [Sphingomonas parapaucimobilis NBRC 15100]|uniref:Uncharacterized protein n=2 Tax=Sphingomonas parapaucimobilis TaxID=28213 RepID=A0A0A1W5X4_9SPHN|nr:hypothetical protein SP5_035_01450 [Sphingomonas parapaucimobilis NBRC 15100]
MSFSATLQSPEPASRFVECEDCTACGPSVKIVDGDDADAKASAAAAWNTRVTSPAGQEVTRAAPPAMDREAVEKALTSCRDQFAFQGEGWQPIETAVLWEVYIVTDGINAAMSQYAESDHGDRFWAVEPEDALEWEPTHCIATPASHASDGGK